MKKLSKAIAAIMLMTVVVFAAGCDLEEDYDSYVEVITYMPEDITSTTVVCCAGIMDVQGFTINEIGLCWSTILNPTVEDSHLSTTNWNETFVCAITDLEPSTEYHVRAFALCDSDYYYGEDMSFTTEDDGGGLNGHDYVDLGLPSGTLWATCNVGATTPEGYGDYFAWGETEPKTIYADSTYRHMHVQYYSNGCCDWLLTKYCWNSYYGYNGFTDDLTVLQPSDDAATVNWGNGWCMPTKDQWQELIDNTEIQWVSQNGVTGKLLTAPNGNSLFLPASGSCLGDLFVFVGNEGFYWSNSLNVDNNTLSGTQGAWCCYFRANDPPRAALDFRTYGEVVRAVCSK